MTAKQPYRAGRCNYTYVCLIDADGTFEVGPMDWDVAKTGLGTYVITHNLGDLVYIALPVPLSGADYKLNTSITDRTANTVTVSIFSSTQAVDFDFGLLVMETH